MAVLNPFKAVRPTKELAARVAALPYDVMNREEAKKMAEGNEYSFLHIDRAEIDLPDNTNPYDKKVYEKAKENLNDMINKGTLIQDEQACFYIYKLIMNGKAQTGIVGCVSIDDYINNVVKKHEHTRQDKENDRINHVDVCDANTGPIFLTYRYNDEVNNIINTWTQKEPLYKFTAEDGVEHIVWIVNDKNDTDNIANIFSRIDSLYIADGHHRAASAIKVGLKRRKENPNYKGDEEFNFFLSVLFPDSDLNIMDYNRVVKELNGFTNEEYMDKVSEKFNVSIYEEDGQYKPECNHNYGMYLDGKWYKLEAKEGTYNDLDIVKRLDVYILQKNLLEPILGIKDPRTDDRIDFVGGIRGLKELERRVAEQAEGVAFAMYPPSMEELLDVADAGEVMPPKSTWFEPKLRSGIFIHKLK
ncbi:DUF1015 domain-containing protein [Clostridium sp. P21]|uniref:DUF1015 domain-containing protein n=1 Tax=Clostridium muellerianum TaxID=2716538 RepID=A0A7Y0HQF7_9CLOT|nr:DUF1015 family protein [Clostridium muellerianum]NMM64111.1 DUF1015 domain-containing protein [Clostridium muellerianum]